MSPLKIFKYRVRFLTPAFIGNADKSGQWRVPPFKEQLRYWWRVFYASDHAFNVNIAEMRRAEGMLFGNAWLQEGATKSLVQIRLSEWKRGILDSWKGVKKEVFHPEVRQAHNQVAPDLYLGYGPLTVKKINNQWRTTLAVDSGIAPIEGAVLSLRVPNSYYESLQHVLFLMDCFGSVGGRSRNGWGAYELIPKDDTPEFNNNLSRFLRNWRDALQLDWPHAIGQDDKGPLIWCTAPRNNWQDVIRDLAIIKVGIRTQFRFFLNGSAGDIVQRRGKIKHAIPQDRHWLAYPVTNHSVSSWDKKKFPWGDKVSRLPNTLRFTVKRTRDNQLKGLIFHMPCRPPDEFMPDLDALKNVWQKVHRLLDELTKPAAQRRYNMINNNERRNQPRPELDNITLHRGQGGCQ